MNIFVLSGRLAADPELKTGREGTVICKIYLANNENIFGKEKSSFFRATIFGKSGEAAAKYLKKGDGVIITGRLEVNKYQTERGENKESTDLIVDKWDFPPSSGGNNNRQKDGSNAEPGYASATRAPAAPVSSYRPEPPLREEDLPF